MKRAFIIIVVITLSFVSILTVGAIAPPCDEPCNDPNSQWTLVANVSVPSPPLCPGCTLTISYYYRTNYCYYTPLKEITMGAISVQGDCSACLFNFGYLFTYSLDWLTRNNYFVNLLSNGQCIEELRVNTVSCWHFTYDVISQSYVYDICQTQGCCTNKFKICKINNVITVTYIQGNNQYIICEEENGHVCTYICDLIYNYYNPTIPKINIIGNTDKYHSYDDVLISPNPSNGEFKILGSNFIEKDLILSLSNLNGQIYKEILIKTDNGSFDLQLSLDIFPSGSYLIRLFYGENKIITKSIILMNK